MLYDEGTVISDFTPDNIAIQLFNATATALNCISQICCFHVALISCLAINEERYRKMEQRCDVSACLLVLIQPHLIGDHGDELTVGGLAAQVVDGVAEIRVQGIHIAPVPCHLDGVADGALHPAGGGVVFLGNLRVEALGDGVDVLRLIHGEQGRCKTLPCCEGGKGRKTGGHHATGTDHDGRGSSACKEMCIRDRCGQVRITGDARLRAAKAVRH